MRPHVSWLVGEQHSAVGRQRGHTVWWKLCSVRQSVTCSHRLHELSHPASTRR